MKKKELIAKINDLAEQFEDFKRDTESEMRNMQKKFDDLPHEESEIEENEKEE